MQKKKFYKGLVIILAVLLLVVIGYLLTVKFKKDHIVKAVREGKILIDQESHEWSVYDIENPLKISIYVRNTSNYLINGILVFSATLEGKGLEKKFLEEFLNFFLESYGEKRMLEKLKEKPGGKSNAIRAYLVRERKLEQGYEYEPIIQKEQDYSFNFRKKVLLKPGEVIRIVHEQSIPPAEVGYLLKVKIAGIEFK